MRTDYCATRLLRVCCVRVKQAAVGLLPALQGQQWGLRATVPELTHLPALPGGAGRALCRGAWPDHPEPVQKFPKEERGQQRFRDRPQGQDGAAPSLQTLLAP